MIKVNKINGQEFLVTVEEGGSISSHKVSMDEGYYRKLSGGKIAREELIKKSFDFLLERESKESILSEFNLKIIKKYFPEYEKEMMV
jgi:hypothetical protein